jgi:hypothetical protein
VCFLVLETHFAVNLVSVSFTQSILNFRPFGVLSLASRLLSGQAEPVQQRIFHQAEKELKLCRGCDIAPAIEKVI